MGDGSDSQSSETVPTVTDDAVDREPVHLIPIDEPTLSRLLAVAVSDAIPEEVMAPVAGPPGWTVARREAFADYHRSRRHPYAEHREEITYAVTHKGVVVGAARLTSDTDPLAREVGLWLGRFHRGQGLGTAVLPVAAERARGLGARRLVARTTSANEPAVRALVGQGFLMTHDAAGGVEAVLPLE